MGNGGFPKTINEKPEDGNSRFLQKLSIHLQDYMMSQARIQEPKLSLP
jgi:hypothetical protein